MAIDLTTLVVPVKTAVNGPGGSIVVATNTEWKNSIRLGFWRAKMDGYFTDYRLDPNADNAITPVPPLTDDMPGELQQLIIELTALDALELAVLGMDTKFAAKSGEESIEIEKSASAITTILKARRANLDRLHTQLVESGYTTYVHFADLVTMRVGSCMSTAQTWVS